MNDADEDAVMEWQNAIKIPAERSKQNSLNMIRKQLALDYCASNTNYLNQFKQKQQNCVK